MLMNRLFTCPLILLLCIGCAVLPIISLSDLSYLYNEKRIFQIGILVVGAVIMVSMPHKMWYSSSEKSKYYVKYYVWGAVLIFLVSIISTLSTPFPFYALVEISLFLLLLNLVGYIAVISKNETYIPLIIFGTACLFALLYFIKFGIQYYFHVNGYVSFWLWPGGVSSSQLVGFNNIRFFNQVQVFTLPLIIGCSLFFKNKKLLSVFILFLSLIWWMLLIQSAGRGAIMSVLTTGLLVLVLYREKAHQWIWYFLGSLALGYTAKVLLFDVIPDPDYTKSIVRGGSSRLNLWPKVFLASLEKPVLGYGPMSFASLHSDFHRGHPHNSILQLLYEFGYPVTITIIGGVLYGVKKWIDQTKNLFLKLEESINSDGIIRISLTAALLGGLLYSLFSGVIVMPLSQLWLAMVAGTMVGLYIRESGKYALSLNKWKVYTVKMVALLAAGILLSVAVKDVPNFQENKKKYMKEASRATVYPRFWQQGKIGLDESAKFELFQTKSKQEK